MEWLTGHKIPIHDWAEGAVDWLIDNASWLFDAMADVMEALIDAFLWVLQTPHPFVIVGAIVLAVFAARRSFGVAAFVLVGLLFIINQGYWEETTLLRAVNGLNCWSCKPR